MATSGKKKTTMAKLQRESRLRERRIDKQTKKNARRQAALMESEQDAATQVRDDASGVDPVGPDRDAVV